MKDYRGTGAIEAFEYENARIDSAAITEKNEKQYFRQQLSISRNPRGIFPCTDDFTDNPAVQCDVRM